MLLLAFAFVAALPGPADWVPMRWPVADAKSLALLEDHPVNCLLVGESSWSAEFAKEANARGAVVLKLSLDGVASLDGKPVVTFTERHRMRMRDDAIAATSQGVWPGIRGEEEGKAHAAASGAAWIDTNAGFLRFARASAPAGATLWIANEPPPRSIYPVTRYLQAIGDAAMTGARWVLAFDRDFSQRLFSGEARALREWKRIGEQLRFLESHKEWRGARAYSKLALVQSAESGALVSGGVLDMIAVKHTPVNPIPSGKLDRAAMQAAQLAVDIDPAGLTPEQKDTLKAFTRDGGTLLTGPPGWKFPDLKPGQIELAKEDLEKLDSIWKEMNAMIGRRNLGARLFNVSSMLSNLQVTADGKRMLLHLVNYSDYPAESVTVHLLGPYKSATIFRPEKPEGQKMELYAIDEGMGFDVDQVGAIATIVLEP